jgi:hypothetical protein
VHGHCIGFVLGAACRWQPAARPRIRRAAVYHVPRHRSHDDRSGAGRRSKLPAIARRSGSTAEYLAGKIIVPHPAMPGIALTADEVRDIVAYIVSLKQSD